MTTTPSQALRLTQHRRRWRAFATAATVAAVTVCLIVLSFQGSQDHAQPAGPSPSADLPHPSGPPWRYGPGAARFTVIVYADLECPFCQSYTPELQQWIASQHDVNLQWHHLPLSIHQPAATQQALWVECAGEAIGHAGFWDAVSWVYAHTRGDGLGLPPGVAYPEHGSPEQQQAVRACLASERPAAVVSAQAQEARQAGVDATPSLRLIDHASERSMLLSGPVIGDALLSALDLLSSPEATAAELSADVVSDMPR